jgi:hypothetical protein
MTSEAYGFVADLLLETNNHCYGDDHNGQPKRNADGGNTHGRTRNILPSLLKMDAFSYEKL